MIRHLVMVLAISLCTIVTAYADHGAPDMSPGPMPCLMESVRPPQPMDKKLPPNQPFITFSPEQKQQINAIQAEERKQVEALSGQMQEAHESLMAMELSSSFNINDFRKTAEEIASIEVELMVLRAKTDYALRKLLTSEQKNRFIQLGLRHSLNPQMATGFDDRGSDPKPERPRPGCDY